MDKRNTKMKKFTIRGVFDGLRNTVGSQQPKGDVIDIEETLRSDHFQIAKTVRHGFPYQPTAMAYDPVQNLLAIGTRNGSLRIFGQPGVDCHMRHEGDPAILQILFLVNEGALVTVCSDDNLHLWTLRQKRPEIVHSLKFQRERITYCHLPFQSRWLYIGTERGNVHIVNIESFVLSGYVINWNKAIELSRKTHPGQVVHLSDNPVDPNKMLIGFESGAIVLWDLKSKTAENRYSSQEGVVLQGLKSLSWHHEGKQFLCSHADGSLATWNYKQPQKPVSVLMPHAKIGKDGKPEPCRPITKVEWKSVRNGEPYVIFSGGMPYDKASRTPSLTVMHAKNTTVLEMEHNVVDFLTLCSTPWDSDFQDPYGIVVLLQNDLVVVDLTSPGYPCFENPYPMDIHESPVTSCQYYADCPPDLIPAFYSVGSKQKRTGFSEKKWPVQGGEWGTTTCSYPEIMLTGHADGSVKFWDASAVTLLVLYKLKTAKVFERSKCRSPEPDDDPFAVQHMQLCNESRLLVVAGLSHVVLFRFNKAENTIDPTVLEISIVYEIFDEVDSPEVEYPPHPPDQSRKPLGSSGPSGSVGSYGSSASDGKDMTSVRVKSGARRWAPGYQPYLCCVMTWIDGEPPPSITSCQVNSRYGLLAFGNEYGIAIVDIIQRTCLLNMGTPDLYGSMDPYSRVPRSPKSRGQRDRPQGLEGLSQSLTAAVEESKSPTTDQCESSSSPSPAVSGTASPRHNPQLRSISEVEACDSVASTAVTFALCNNEDEYVVIEGAMEATEDITDNASEASHGVFDDTDTGSQCSVSDGLSSASSLMQQVQDPNHNTSKQALGINNSSPAKRPLGASKSVPLQSSPLQPQRRLTEPSHPPPEQQDEEPGESLPLDTANNGQEAESINNDSKQAADTEPVAPPRRKKSHKSLFRLKHKDDASRKLTPPAHWEDHGSHGPPVYKERQFRSESDLGKVVSDNLQALAAAVAAEEAAEAAGATSDTTTANDPDPEAVVIKTSPPQAAESAEDLTDAPSMAPKNKSSFMRRLSSKMKIIVRKSIVDEHEEGHEAAPRRRNRLDEKFDMIDLTSDEDGKNAVTRRVTYYAHVTADKADGSFSRSRSSSMSSLENISKEAISSLVFADSYTRKTDSFTCPCLWVGTSLGSVLVIQLNLPAEGEQRMTQPVIVSPSGTIFRLRGAILSMSFLDCNGVLIPAITDPWMDCNQSPGRGGSEKKYNSLHKYVEVWKQKVPSPSRPYPGQQSVSSTKSRMSPTSSTEQPCDRQFAIICSEKQARVMSLPSQTCAYKVKITETSLVANAKIVSLKDSVCLACYLANGHVMTLSLPSLRPMLDVDYLPQADVRIAKTFSFSNNGHALFFCSPTEVQKVTLSAEAGESLNEMLGGLFLPTETPEAPKQNFFKNFFTGGPSLLDREELFGESSGKASKGVAKYQAGMASAQQSAGQATSAIAIARQAVIERGEKLRVTEEATERMRMEAEQFSSSTYQLMARYRDKKWYQL